MKPIRVTHVISGIDRADGGPTTALIGLAGALSQMRAEVRVVATPRAPRDESVEEELRNRGVSVRTADYRMAALGRNAKLRAILSEEIARSDVVHIHALWEEAQYQAACLSRAHRRPFIVRPCGLLDPWSMAQHRLKKRMYLELRLRRHLNAAAAIHFTTPLEEERARSVGLLAPPIVEANGIDLHAFEKAPPPGSFRKRLGLDSDVPLVLYLGRLHPKKGLDLLIPAFADAGPGGAMLVIAGSGEVGYEQALRRSVASSAIGERVLFTGFLEGRERIAAFADATLFVLPSYSENFANTVVESLAAGTPVVVSDQVNLHPEIASAKVGGVVAMERDALASEIRAWLEDTSRRERAIANAGSFAATYDQAKIAARWLSRYRELTQHMHGAAA